MESYRVRFCSSRIINSETLSLLQQYWLLYAATGQARTQSFRFRNECRLMYGRSPSGFATQSIQTVARSFGARLVNSLDLVNYHVDAFQDSGFLGDASSHHERVANPLALISSTARDRFCIHYRTNPLAAFNLGTSLTL